MEKQILTILLIFVAVLFTNCGGNSTKKKDLEWIKIGNQVWMAENLNVTTFSNGEPIPQAKTADEWVTVENSEHIDPLKTK